MRTRAAVRTFVLAALAVALLAACQPVEVDSTGRGHSTVAVPDVVGDRLSTALRAMLKLGLVNVSPTDDTGRDRTVVDPVNWVVDTQTPKAGTKVKKTASIKLRVRRPSDATGVPSARDGVVPDVVCLNLQDAQDALQNAGFDDLHSVDGTGKDRIQIIDRDWLVIKQSVPAGSKPDSGTAIKLTVVKYGEKTGSSGCKS